jgi:hypothetical protein
LEVEPSFRKRGQSLKRAIQQLEALLGQTGSSLDALGGQPATAASVRELERLRARFDETAKAYLDQNAAFLDFLRQQAHKIEESNRRAAMSEKRSRPARNEARIQQLSDELTRDLRLQRIEAAIKELLDFQSDEDFFSTNASTGRRRRLRTLQTAIEKALQK